MDRLVSVSRHRKSGAFILHPFGTFRGYGGLVGLRAYRELTADADPAALGLAIIEAFERCTAYNCHIRDAPSILDTLEDIETKRIRTKYNLASPRATTGWLAQRFLRAQIVMPRRNKSWIVKPLEYSHQTKLDYADKARAVRVSFRAGSSALGRALLELLTEPVPNKRMNRSRF